MLGEVTKTNKSVKIAENFTNVNERIMLIVILKFVTKNYYISSRVPNNFEAQPKVPNEVDV